MSTNESWASSDGTRRSMLSNQRRDTRPELELRRRLHAAGLRYRVDYPLPIDRRRRADIAFTRLKLAVFVDGCFWHACPIHGTLPRTNADYWLPKLARNRERDLETNERLRELGWTVLRFWEHQSTDEMSMAVVRQAQSMRRRVAG